MTFITKQEKFVQVREFAKYVMEQAGKGQTIAALVEDFNTTAEVLGFGHLWIAKPGRVAKLIEAMEHVLKRLDAMPEFAERVPDVTPEKRAEHLEHAEQLRGILRSHGIDAKDFDACLDYILGNGNIVPRYWVKIYVDYIHGEDLDATRYTASLPPLGRATVPDASPLVVTSGQAKWLRDQGYGGELTVADHFPPFADEAHIPSRSVPPVGFYQCMGRGIRITDPAASALEQGKVIHSQIEYGMQIAALRDGLSHATSWHSMTEQEARASHSRANINTGKANRFPRGKCAARMVELGWVFND